jgi:hypothetical protein
VQVYCNLTYPSLDIFPRVVSLDHVGVLLLPFWRISLLFSIMVHWFLFLPTVYRGSYFAIHQHFLFLLLNMTWSLSVVLVCVCFIMREVEHFLSKVFIPIPLKIPYAIHVPIFALSCWFFRGWVFELLVCRFWILVPYQMQSWAFCGQSLEFTYCFFCSVEVL